MIIDSLFKQIIAKRSFLCIGLDTDITKIPSFLHKFDDPVYEFNKRIIESTKDLCIAYKPNLAFYESMGKKGWESLQKTLDIIPDEIFTIADAKRGDIGNTATQYAKAFFEELKFDSITVAPYMGKDSVLPFLQFDNKVVILLALTSNAGSLDFQFLRDEEGKQLFEYVISKACEWGSVDKMMFVIGATRSEHFRYVRKLAPDNFLLVPGVGAQGGSFDEVCQYGMNNKVGLLINSSRGIIYAGDGEDFDVKARESALLLQKKMEEVLSKKDFI